MKKKKDKESGAIDMSWKSIPSSMLNKILIGILLLLPLIFFAPLLSGQKMMGGSDWLLAGYSSRHWLADCIRLYHRPPLWDPLAFGGLPTGNSYTLYNLWFNIFPTHIAWTYIFVLGMFLAGLGVYLYLKEIKLSLYSAFLGALIYMGSGSVLSTTSPGHDGKLLATALVPFVFLFLHKGLTKHKFLDFLLAGAIGGIAAVNAHFQLVYYSVIALAFYFIFHLIWQRKENKAKGTFKLISYAFCALLLAAGLLAIQYLPTFAGIGWGARGGERGYKFATSWALPISELWDLITPHFSGLLDNYWGENYFKLDTQYLGILPLILALFTIIFMIKNSYVKFFTGLAVVAIIFALGGHTLFYHIPYAILPGIKKFRGPAMSFYLVAFSISVLASIGIQNLIEEQNTKAKIQKRVPLYLGIMFAIIAVLAIIFSAGKESILEYFKSHFGPIFTGEYGAQMSQYKLQNLYKNYPVFLEGLGKAVFLAALNCVLIFLLYAKKLKLPIGIALVGGLLVFDQWSIEKQFLKIVPHPSEYYAADDMVGTLISENIPDYSYRVFPLLYDHTTDGYLCIHGIQSVGGYVSNPGERYQKFIGADNSVMFTPPNLVRYKNLLNILNVKYIFSAWLPEDLTPYPENTRQMIENFRMGFLGQWGVDFRDFHNNFIIDYKTPDGKAVYRNESALPRALIVHSFEILSKTSVLERLKQPDFNPRTTVVLEEQPMKQVSTLQSPDSNIQNSETVKIDEYTPNKIICTANLAIPGFLVLSENWHPDWKVYVDGKKDKLYVADYILRGVQLDKGAHKIEFVYDSFYFKLGALISLLASLLLIVIIILKIKSIRLK
ncbi:MAG: YfhO family protein [bacterium]|nr:YfhO family protein [bacterium]